MSDGTSRDCSCQQTDVRCEGSLVGETTERGVTDHPTAPLPLVLMHFNLNLKKHDFSQLYLFPPLRFEVSFVCEHRKHYSDELMSSGKNGLLVDEAFFSSLEVVCAKDLVGDDDPDCHKPYHSP